MMKVGETFNHLLEKILSHFLSQLSSLSDICEEVSTRTQLYHKAYVLVRLERIVESYHALLVALLQDRKLLHDLFLLWVIHVDQNILLNLFVVLFLLVLRRGFQELFVD